MLTHLSVKNFAIIEDIDLDFKDGLTVLTGETGAGKSLIIDSIHLLIGERAALEMIRNGEDKAIISGTFSFKNIRLKALLDNLDIFYENDEITITRIISNNKNSIKINDKSVTLVELKSIAKFLADIHAQFDMVKLLNKDNYLDIVDGMRYELVNEYKDKYLSSLSILKKKKDEYDNLLATINDIKQKREEYEYQLSELKSFDLKENEEIELKERIQLLKNYDKIYALFQANKEIIDKDTIADLYTFNDNLKELSQYQSEFKDTANSFNDLYYEIEAIFDDFSHKFHNLEYSPEELDNLQNRENELNLLKNKYKKNIIELIEYRNSLEEILSSKEDLDYSVNEKYDELKKQYEETYQLASDLTAVRKKISIDMEKELMENLKDLALNSSFKIEIISAKKEESLSLDIFKESGIDEIEFLIETNIGEGLKPLSKVLSGGEMSRIMLALKILFIKSQKISTVIFDEVDTGISGEIARKVALKIKELSLSTQVIAITHLPQVASLSTNHIKISKSVSNGRTYTNIKELNLQEKIYEIANLISGGKVTEKQLEYAKEMVMNN